MCERISADHRSSKIKNKHEKLSPTFLVAALRSRGVSFSHAAIYWQVTESSEFCLFWFRLALSYDANKQIESIRGWNEGEIRIFKTPPDFLECFEVFFDEFGRLKSTNLATTTFWLRNRDEMIEKSKIEVQGEPKEFRRSGIFFSRKRDFTPPEHRGCLARPSRNPSSSNF